MKHLARAATAPTRLNWRDPQTLIRLGILVAVVTAVLTAVLLRNSLDLDQVGYGAVALAVLVASGGLVVPVPALATACTAAAFLNPAFIGLIAGSVGTVGELTGYYLGSTGRGVIHRTRLYRKLESWMSRRGWVVLFLLAVIPNPIFDVAGIAAGALHYPVWRFMLVVWLGKTIKFLIFAYACSQGADWLTSVFGL
jgi:membrane protein YqaA with SNARE-associated domain